MSSVPRHASAAINHPTLPTDHAIPPVNSTSPAIPITSPLAPPAKTAPATTLPSTIAPAPPTSPSEPSHPLSPSEPDEQAAGTITPPVPLVNISIPLHVHLHVSFTDSTQVHLRVLVISGESHVFTFEPELAVGRMVGLDLLPFLILHFMLPWMCADVVIAERAHLEYVAFRWVHRDFFRLSQTDGPTRQTGRLLRNLLHRVS